MKCWVVVLLVSLFALSCSYLPEKGGVDDRYLRSDKADYALYYSSETVPANAFIMVPGGLVDPYVYSCWIDRLVDEDSSIAVVLVKYPTNLAITNIHKVMKVAGELKEFKHWVIGGHSLGGVVAATVVNENREFFDGLVMMASWSREATNLSDWEGAVLSIYASEDQLATKEEVFSNRNFLPDGDTIDSPGSLAEAEGRTTYYDIIGGNHSGFGCYGQQEGDGEALISKDNQQEQMVLLMSAFFNALW
jgi:pimeloyl-ACP methyl ester carboxylesterase